MEEDEIKLAIIVPCYNEYDRFPLMSFGTFIVNNPDVRFCFVNDGSSDQTQYLLDDLESKHKKNVCILQLKRNCGKGEAVRRGMNHVTSSFSTKYLCYLDADLSTPLEEVLRLYLLLKEQKVLLFVFGSRVSVFGSQIKRFNYRHYGGRVVATMIDSVLRLSIYDTQCGLKIFTRTLANRLFSDSFTSKWLFDVEIFAKMKILYSGIELNQIMKEIPLNQWTEKGDSKVKLMDIIKIPFVLLAIYYRYRIKSIEKQADNSREVLPEFSPLHSNLNH